MQVRKRFAFTIICLILAALATNPIQAQNYTQEASISGNPLISGLDSTLDKKASHEVPEKEVLKIWPNPGEGRIMMDLPAAGNYTVKIFSTEGRMVRSDEFSSAAGHTMLDISQENKGLYILSIQGPETSTTRKYIKK